MRDTIAKAREAEQIQWMEMVTANLVREGIDKHKARELAAHFYGLAPAAPVQEPLMVDIYPPATQRDRWMYEQGRLAERDPRSHTTPPAQPTPVPLTGGRARDMPDCWVVIKDGRIIATHDEPCHHDGIQAVRYAPAAQPAPTVQEPEQQQPMAVVEIAVSPLRSIVVTHIPGTPFPRVGDFVYSKPEKGTPT
jgi:hypothetical protein